MKTKLFIYSKVKETVSRTYGGSNYTLNVYEVVDNDVIFISEVHACTRAHKGEISEAFGALIKARPEIKANLIKRAKQVLKTDSENYFAKSAISNINNSGGYYTSFYENFGVKLISI